MPRKYLFLLILLYCSGCGIQIQEIGAVTPTESIVTATLPATQTLIPTLTPLPPLPTLTPAPFSGTSTTPINVRAAPSTASEALGIIPANTSVQIVGTDPGGNWWLILYPQGKDGKGWVAAQYVSAPDGIEVPVIGGGGSNSHTNTGIVQQKLNIRSGPGTNFNSIGALNAQDVVALTGKDSNGAWLQIEFAAGPDGKGWISAAFIQVKDASNLPIVTEAGAVIGTGTPINTPLPSTPTVVPAPDDYDSAEAPAIDVVLMANGTRTIQFGSDVSAPSGDRQDWIAFTPFTQNVLLEVSCSGGGRLAIDILYNNNRLSNWEIMDCGDSRVVSVQAGGKYVALIQAETSAELNYVRYVMRIASLP